MTETEEKTDKTKRKKYRRPKTKLSYGPRGLDVLRLCFQLGGMTPQQHARFFDTRVKYSYRLLSALAEQRLLESAPVQTAGRPRGFHFLSKSYGSRAIAVGGHEAGLRSEARSKSQHKLHGLPQHAEHSHAVNNLYLSLLEAARASQDSAVEVPLWGLWAESFGGFPLRGMKRGEKVYPDGVFEVCFDGLSCRYYLEYESRSRPGEVLGKLDSYGSHFHRMLKEDADNMKDWLRPLVFLFSGVETTMKVSNVVKGAIRAEAPELSRYFAWRNAAVKAGVNAGRLVLFVSLDDLEEARALGTAGALSTRYAALGLYDEGAPGVARNLSQVSLGAAGREVAGAATRAAGGASL